MTKLGIWVGASLWALCFVSEEPLQEWFFLCFFLVDAEMLGIQVIEFLVQGVAHVLRSRASERRGTWKEPGRLRGLFGDFFGPTAVVNQPQLA